MSLEAQISHPACFAGFAGSSHFFREVRPQHPEHFCFYSASEGGEGKGAGHIGTVIWHVGEFSISWWAAQRPAQICKHSIALCSHGSSGASVSPLAI